MNSYVMFGFSHFFGDIYDCIAQRGERLTKVVLNVPETLFPGRLSLQGRLARLDHTVVIERLENWKPIRGESYVIGFSRKIIGPLAWQLKEKHDCQFRPLVHPTAILQTGYLFSEGVIVNAGAIVGPWAKIGKHTIVNRGANVGHDCEIGDYCFLSPGATLCSHVKLGENVLVGANATILPDVHVGDNAVIGAGAVVTKDVRPDVTVFGVPAFEKRAGGKY